MGSQNMPRTGTGKAVSAKAVRSVPFQRTTTKVHSTPSKSHAKARSVKLGPAKN
jgi:hypothetical protein